MGIFKRKNKSSPVKTLDVNMPSEIDVPQQNVKEDVVSTVGVATDIGKRKSQQDAAGVSAVDFGIDYKGRWLGVLCDGMGGMNGGEYASATTVKKMINNFSKAENKPVMDFLLDSIIDCDDAVFQLKDSSGKLMGSGSTLVSIVVEDGKMYWGCVGDSHLYVIRGEQIRRMNKEHNYYAELLKMVEDGKITIQQANTDPQREALTSFIGIGGISQMDINGPFNLNSGDIVVICSDGLYRSVSQKEICDIMKSNINNMQQAANNLVGAALDKKSPYQDNVTVVTMRYV